MENKIVLGDCLDEMKAIPACSVDLVYLDPPFFTGRIHTSSNREGSKRYSFGDVWKHSEQYLGFLVDRLTACKRLMSHEASIFLHCDHNSTHIARQALDFVFGEDRFQSEIIWSYKRWSNAKKGLLQQHQNIIFYSKSSDFKWNALLTEYSATTNIDQILQKRTRDVRGKAAYATSKNGEVIYGDSKKGVPLGDVWDIPFLNPKAKERTGYPTQKPLLLLERIIGLTTSEGDLVFDPFCGSGTTLVAAKLLGRRYLGIDSSPDAVALTEHRLDAPVRTESALLKKGVESYVNNDPWVDAHLSGFSCSRIQRNAGADAILKDLVQGKTAFVRVQRQGEPLSKAVGALEKAINSKGKTLGILIATENELFESIAKSNIRILHSPALQLAKWSECNDKRPENLKKIA